MIRNRLLLRSFAIFFLLEILVSTIVPTISWGLTAGPTSPEFSSFEPVDTTDMVNLATGDLVYNTPVLEVPGPEGGYPLSLSYHAGIKLDQEASWVGLGFTLNPGAINRNVNGYPDDNYNTQTKVADYWGGGQTTTKTNTFSISAIGITASYASASTSDTYKGFSTNATTGISVDPVMLALSVISNFKKTSILNFSRDSKNYTSENSNLTGIGGAESYGKADLYGNLGGVSLGISMDSKSTNTSLSVFGTELTAHNNFAGKISSFSSASQDGLTLSYSPSKELTISIGYNRSTYFTRYWSDEAQSLFTYGSLYPGAGNQELDMDIYKNNNVDSLISYAFDSYDLYDRTVTEPGHQTTTGLPSTADDINDPQRQMGGSLPAYDQFGVLGQGIEGVMQPFIFENGDLYGQSLYERTQFGYPALSHPTLQYKSLKKFSDKKVDFRFLNDFSNSLLVTPSGFHFDGDNNLVVDSHSVQADQGFNNNNNNQKLAGSKHIEWFTNEEIVNGEATQMGFVDFYENLSDRKLSFEIFDNYLQPEEAVPYTETPPNGSADGKFVTYTYSEAKKSSSSSTPTTIRYQSIRGKKIDISKRIGGFKVTNASGVTYHYALPVYNYNEYSRSIVKNPRKGAPTFKEFFNNEPYAYTWLLTAVTGPDYVDKNQNGILDDNDWGYWVKFDYGKWADAYQWRTPFTGFLTDSESGNRTFTYGIKELYYLDAIETRSHKAIFIKSKKKDGRGVTSRLEGDCKPRRFTLSYGGKSTNNLTYNVSPVSTMKLDAIYLFKKDELTSIPLDKTRGEKYMEGPYTWKYEGETIKDFKDEHIILQKDKDYVTVKYHTGDLVYDDDDIHDLPEFREKALRIIEFDTDYSLAGGTSNSLGYFSDTHPTPQFNCSCIGLDARIGLDFEWPTNLDGKCIDPFVGVNPTCCVDNRSIYSQNSIFNRYNRNDCNQSQGSFLGSFLQYKLLGKLTLKSLKFFGRGGTSVIPATTFEYEENPGYNPSYYDEWGYYDNDRAQLDTDSRRITDLSAAHVQAWSLKSITSPLGAEFTIEYEPNQYRKSVYNDFSTFGIDDIQTNDDDTNVELFFSEKFADFPKWFSTGQSIDFRALLVYNFNPIFDKDLNNWLSLGVLMSAQPLINTLQKRYNNANGLDFYLNVGSQVFQSDETEKIVAVKENSIVIQSARLKELSTRKIFPASVDVGLGEVTQRIFNCHPYYVSGFIKVNDPEEKYSGGIRVRSIASTDANLRTNKTVYEYTSPVDGQSSGVTSYKPFNQPFCQYASGVGFFDAIFTQDLVKSEREHLVDYQSTFQHMMNEPYEKILTFSREIPAPGTLYEYVTVRNYVDDSEMENYTTYHFKVFDESMVEQTDEIISATTTLTQKKTTIKNRVSDVGSLLDVKTYNNASNLLRSREYNYLYDNNVQPFEQPAIAAKQGIIDQSFHKHIALHEYNVTTETYNWFEQTFTDKTAYSTLYTPIFSTEKALITKREDQANVLSGTRETDYKLGIVTETKNYEFDFFSGVPLKVISSDSYGNNYMTINEPAYQHYSAMGLKVFNPFNSHMLTQASATYSYKINDAFEPTGLINASVQTWSDQTPVLNLDLPQQNVWRKGISYQWNGQQFLNPDGTYHIDDFTNHAFTNWINPSNQQVEEWQKISEPTLYNVYSRGLEEKDINENYSSVRMDPKQQKVLAGATNARYNEIVFAGMENYEGNTVQLGSASQGDGNPSPAHIHTGQYSLLVGSAHTGFNYTLRAESADITKKYRASVWVYVPGESETQPELNQLQLYYSVNNQEISAVHPTLQKSKSKSWYQLNLDILPDGSGDIFIGVRNNTQRGVYFDDFRVQPLGSVMTSYVYDPVTDELIYILDPNNFYTRFEYDAMGRLVRTSKELLNFDFGDGKESFRADEIVKEMKYNYGQSK